MDIQLDFLPILEKPETSFAPEPTMNPSVDLCPECDNEITRNGRCKTCYSCGWSSCDL